MEAVPTSKRVEIRWTIRTKIYLSHKCADSRTVDQCIRRDECSRPVPLSLRKYRALLPDRRKRHVSGGWCMSQ